MRTNSCSGRNLARRKLGGLTPPLAQAAGVLRILQGQSGPAAARGERSRDGQHDVAQRFRVEPAAIHPPQQAIVGIDRVRPAVVGAAHGVGTAQDQAADQALLGPAVRDEPQRQGVEQLGMRGRLAATCRSNRPSGRSPRRTAFARCDSRRPARSADCRRSRSSRPVGGGRSHRTGSMPAGSARRPARTLEGPGRPARGRCPGS